MHRFIIAPLALCSTVVTGQSVEYCKHIENVAQAAMTSRQAGVPLTTMRQLVSDETAIGVFEAAYEYPQLLSETDRQAAVISFKELILNECLKS